MITMHDYVVSFILLFAFSIISAIIRIYCDPILGCESTVEHHWTKCNIMVFISVSSPHHEIMLNVLPHYAQKVKFHENNHFLFSHYALMKYKAVKQRQSFLPSTTLLMIGFFHY